MVRMPVAPALIARHVGDGTRSHYDAVHVSIPVLLVRATLSLLCDNKQVTPDSTFDQDLSTSLPHHIPDYTRVTARRLQVSQFWTIFQ